ncbi:MAG: hypothetical protein KIPDCIKN_04350 [Haliscomenobacter sp.]|nr:hypothetical protein [Haliscomenobacter sp.]
MNTLPFSILYSSAEQLPFNFDGIASHCRSTRTRRTYLKTSDYSLGCHTCDQQLVGPLAIGIERKSLSDLYQSFTHGRERFERAMQRLGGEFGYAALVIEADWTQIVYPNTYLQHPTEALPKAIFASILSWSMKYNIHVYTCPDRQFATVTTFRLLEWRFRQLVSSKRCAELMHYEGDHHRDAGRKASDGQPAPGEHRHDA